MDANMQPARLSRRSLLSGASISALGMGSFVSPLRQTAAQQIEPGRAARADHCIMIWLGGGMAQIDTFDPKRRGDGKSKPGSYYAAIPTAVPEVHVCEHLSRCAPLTDRMTIIRTVNHDVIDEHAAAVVRVHTGRPLSGTIQYPSLGSIISYSRGSVDPNVPAYVVVGYPNTARDAGFLGPEYGYLYVTDTKNRPAALDRAKSVTVARQAQRERLLKELRLAGPTDEALNDYDRLLEQSLRLSGPEFMRVFDLNRETDQIRGLYGSEFGQRCLLGRRLVEKGVRFVEISHNLNFVNGTGWDTHNQGQQNQHLLIKELDTALAALIDDLQRRSLLDKTLVVVATEFGRPAGFDAGGGRGHYAKAFSMVLAGGGLRHRGAYGVTDELGMKIESDPVSIPDFLATICATLQVDPADELYAGDRPVPITDGGHPIAALFP
jgi:hypothetical protein